EARVVDPRLVGQGLHPRARGQRRPRFVERDVPVGADAQDLQVDPARLGDLLLIPRRGGRQVLGGTVGTVDGCLGEVHAGRDLGVDDVAVALRMVAAMPTYSSSMNACAWAKDSPCLSWRPASSSAIRRARETVGSPRIRPAAGPSR